MKYSIFLTINGKDTERICVANNSYEITDEIFRRFPDVDTTCMRCADHFGNLFLDGWRWDVQFRNVDNMYIDDDSYWFDTNTCRVFHIYAYEG